MAVVAALAYAVSGLQSETYTAQSTVVVSSAPGPVNTTTASAAGSLANTYAAALPHDQQLQIYVERTAHLSTSHGAISAPPASGAAVKIRFTASSSASAIKGAKAIVAALTGHAPASGVVTPGTLKLVQSPGRTTLTPSGKHQATVVLVVPSTGGPSEGINPDDADHLATTYAGVIPADDSLLAAVGKATGQSASQASQNLSVVNTQSTSILEISFKASNPADAAKGARTVADLVSGPDPVAAGIVPSSVAVVSLPQQTGAGPGPKHSSSAIAIGAVLGLLLGLVLLVAWERSDPRIRDTRELVNQIGCPATPVDRLSPNAANALLERWASLTDRVPARVAVLPADESVESQTADAVNVLRNAGGHLVRYVDARSGMIHDGLDDRSGNGNGNGDGRTAVVLVHAAPPGGETAGEATALGCDLTVVGVPAGARAADIRALGEELTNFGIVPVWALLTSGGRRAARQARERVADAASH
jgi:capsular polysaccharide biosynthesis protein